MATKRVPYQIPQRAKLILLALLKALVIEPVELVVSNKENDYIGRCCILLREMPPFIRCGFLFFLYAFDRVPFFLGFGLSRFIHLNGEAQTQYVDKWMHSKYTFIKETFKSVRGMVMVCYFSHPDVWKYIGYDPKAHVEERVKLRQDIMKQKGLPSGSLDETGEISSGAPKTISTTETLK